MKPKTVDAILLIYHHPVFKNAPTILEHVRSFGRYSRFPVVGVNTELRFDPALRQYRFPVMVLHYSLFGSAHYMLNEPWYEYIDSHSRSCKVAFFQDEYYFCPQRFAFLNKHNIDIVFTLFEQEYWDRIYRRFTKVPRLVQTLTGYVSDEAIHFSRKYAKRDEQRQIDIGYRARKLPYYMGAGAQEKWLIGKEFLDRAPPHGLRLDISWEERQRIYGTAWYRFLGNCCGVLGAESGVSITDLDGSVFVEHGRLLQENPEMSFAEMSRRLLAPHEGQIPLRTISPRSFESAAMRSCQIMFEGRYNGIMKPMRHYIPLKLDFSNFDEVVRQFKDPGLRREIAENAYHDLVASDLYSYRHFIEGFDDQLTDAGLAPPVDRERTVGQLQRIVRRQSMLHAWAVPRQTARRVASHALHYASYGVRWLPLSWRRSIRRRLGLQPRPSTALTSTELTPPPDVPTRRLP